MTHPTWQLDLTTGSLILTPCPGTKDADLSTSLQQLKSQGAVAVVTALDDHELAEKQVSALGDLVGQLGMKWFQIEIEDDCAPDQFFAAKWQQINDELHGVLNQGGKVVLHCMGGSGRTGILAAHILLEKGWTLPKVIEEIQTLRPNAFQKPSQLDYIQRIAKQAVQL